MAIEKVVIAGREVAVRAYLHKTSDTCVTANQGVYDNPRKLVALDDVMDQLREITLLVTQALNDIDKIVMTKETEVSYEAMQKSGFERPDGWRRKYSLKDARSHAHCAAIQLRTAWDLLDPPLRSKP